MAFRLCDSFYEDTPTLDEVKREISSIVGLPEIKNQLEAIMEKIIDAENHYIYGYTVVPPKPFHMVFTGNIGTGKSQVARILGKLFYLAGTLSSYTVTEIEGNRKMKDARGGVLLVNIDEKDRVTSKTLEDIIAVMDEGETSVILAGSCKALNKCFKLNYKLYKRLSLRLQFDDFTCEELAMILQKKARDKEEKDLICGFELDASCSIDNVAQIIAEVTSAKLRRQLNANLLDHMLIEAREVANGPGETTISLWDLRIGMSNAVRIFKNLLNLRFNFD